MKEFENNNRRKMGKDEFITPNPNAKNDDPLKDVS